MPVILVVISFLVLVLIYSSSLTFDVSAKRVRIEGSLECNTDYDAGVNHCCWKENDIGPFGEVLTTYDVCCTPGESPNTDPECVELEVGHQSGGTDSVFPRENGVFEDPTPPTPPLRTPGQGSLPQDGVFERPPSQGVPPPLTRDQGVLPQDGVLQEPLAEQGAAPRTVEPLAEDEATQPSTEPLPPCPEGQILDEQSGLCVPIESPEAEEPEAAEEPQAEEEQTVTQDEKGAEGNND